MKKHHCVKCGRVVGEDGLVSFIGNKFDNGCEHVLYDFTVIISFGNTGYVIRPPEHITSDNRGMTHIY